MVNQNGNQQNKNSLHSVKDLL